MNRIAEQIKKARLQARLSEKALAKKCGLSENYLKDIESGRKVVKEEIAETILKKLGKSMDSLNPSVDFSQRKGDKSTERKKESPKQPLQDYDLKPTGAWQEALGSLIKTYPVHRLDNQKVVDEKSLPLLKNKVEGHHPDKLFFVKVTDNTMEGLRIKKGDLITVLYTQEIESGAFYLIKAEKGLMIRKLRREGSGKVKLFQGIEGESGINKKINELEIIGKCIKLEFSL